MTAVEIFSSEPRRGSDRIIVDSRRAQALLKLDNGRPNYFAQAIALVLYALALAAIVIFSNSQRAVVEEEPLELVVVPSAPDELPPPDASEETPPPEAVDEPPPPPEAIEPIAPVKPVEPPKPKVEKRVEHKPAPPQASAAHRQTAPAVAGGSASSNPNATQSLAANQFLACMQRAASRAAPDSPIPKHGRVAYRASFSPSGSMTAFNITPSGNALLDGIASRLGSRCGSLPAIGHPFNVSGGVVF
jgi:periplasmic protein TonB